LLYEYGEADSVKVSKGGTDLGGRVLTSGAGVRRMPDMGKEVKC